jgi:hypothetical protein
MTKNSLVDKKKRHSETCLKQEITQFQFTSIKINVNKTTDLYDYPP